MKLSFVCPTFPPNRCGVGDFTGRLTEELARQGHEVRVWTEQASPQATPGVAVQPAARVRGWHGIPEIAADADWLLLQYTPQLYDSFATGGLEWWLARLRHRGPARLGIVFHELHYPVGPNLPGLVYGTNQWLRFITLVQLVDAAIFTYAEARTRWAERLPRRAARFHTLPVGSNIPVTASLGARDETTLVHFGGTHPTHLHGHTLSALRASPGAVLKLVGTDAGAAAKLLKSHGAEELQSRVNALGFLRPAEVSTELARAAVVLAPFLDGVSTRRGSVMAALAHGAPVATTWRQRAPWESFTAGVDAEAGAKAFSELVASLLRDPARRTLLGQMGQKYQEAHFAWPRIAAELVQRLSSSV